METLLSRPDPARRGLSLALVLLLHGAALSLLLQAATPAPPAASAALTVVDVPAPPPPAEEGAAPAPLLADIPATVAPPAIEIAEAPPLPAPVPAPLPAPLAAPAAPPASSGAGASSGNGTGSGAASGLGASGSGAAAVAVRARRIAGNIGRRDFPRVRAKDTPASSVTIRLTVGADGRPTACAIVRPSGTPARDATTCRLALERFRYAPARDASGAAVEDVAGWRQDWWPEARE